MKKLPIAFVSVATLALASTVFADNSKKTPEVVPTQAPNVSNFTPAQVTEIESRVAAYIKKNPQVISDSFQAAMALKQKEELKKMEKAVVANKSKIFQNTADPVAGNVKGSESLVAFMDPNCGFCKKFHKGLDALLQTNKNVKVIYKDIAIMGDPSVLAIKAMLAAKNQGKYSELQKEIYTSDKRLTKKEIMKLASSVGLDTKKLQADMKSKEIQAQIDQNLELSKTLGINGTPTLILGEKTIAPGYLSADDLKTKLKEASSPATPK